MNKLIKIIALPTEDKTDIIKNNSLDFIYHSSHKDYSHWGVSESNHLNYQHLYATVSQDIKPIKEGDWCIDIISNYIYQAGLTPEVNKWESQRKIIVTTDLKLTSFACNQDHGMCFEACQGTCNSIKKMKQSFLKEYCANPDGEWEVEYDCVTSVRGGILDLSKNPAWEQTTNSECVEGKLKLNQDNTVNITKVDSNPILVQKDMSCTLGVGEGDGNMYVHGDYESIKHLQAKLFRMEKMYTKEEVEEILAKYHRNLENWSNNIGRVSVELKNWIKENLI